SWVLVTNERGLLVARTDYPAEFDLDLSRGALIARALAGEQADGPWLDDGAQRLSLAVAIPLRASPDETPQGVLVTAYEVGAELAMFPALRRSTVVALALGIGLALALARRQPRSPRTTDSPGLPSSHPGAGP